MDIATIKQKLTADVLQGLYVRHGAEWGRVNIAGFRSGLSSARDMFDDLICICIVMGMGVVPVPVLKVYEATTDPGKWWTLNPVTYKGVKGAAHLCPGFYKDMWQRGIHAKGSAFAHEALVASSARIRFWRDANKNSIYDPATDPIQEDYNYNIGINCHRAGLDDPENIGKYGAGCQVIHHHHDQEEMIAMIKALPVSAIQQSKFDYLLMDANEVVI